MQTDPIKNSSGRAAIFQKNDQYNYSDMLFRRKETYQTYIKSFEREVPFPFQK